MRLGELFGRVLLAVGWVGLSACGAPSEPGRSEQPEDRASIAQTLAVAPTVTSFSPAKAVQGTTVTVNGSGFVSGASVFFNGMPASSVTFTSSARLKAVVPNGATSGPISVTVPAGTAQSSTSFLVLPKVTSVDPLHAFVGDSLTVSGSGFTGATAVKLGTLSASFSVLSDAAISAAVPAGFVSGKVTVTTPRGNRASATSFTVIVKPTVSSFTPGSSELPITLTVNGSNFIAVSAVKVGAVGVPFSVVNSKQLTATLALGTPSGKISVVNPAGTASSAGTFTAIVCADADADGVCDRDDRCPGSDDHLDSDVDGMPDGCDACASAQNAGQSCGAGLVCDAAGTCQEIECNDGTQGPGVLHGSVAIDCFDTAGDLAKLAGIWCVTGDVSVSSTQLTDLSALSGLVEVGGTLGVGTALGAPTGCGSPGNGQLRGLHGLEGLRRVGGWLEVFDQPSESQIADLTGLSGLQRAGGLMLENLNLLSDLHGLEHLSRVESLYVESANQLVSLNGLQNLTNVGDAHFVNNPLLAAPTALSKLTSLDNLEINQTGMASLHGLENLNAVRVLSIRSDPNLTSLDALSSLRTVSYLSLGDLPISSLSAFSQVQGLLSLELYDLNVSTLVGINSAADLSTLFVYRCPNLTSLAALGTPPIAFAQLQGNKALLDCGTWAPNLNAWIGIADSPLLTSLSCLQGATTMARLTLEGLGVPDLHGLEGLSQLRYLELRNNEELRSLQQLSSLRQVDFADVEGNHNLSQCEIDWLGGQLGGAISVNADNGPACTP